MLFWIILSVLIIILDQAAKYFVVLNISAVDTVHVVPKLFDFVYVRNTGAAFSILSDNTGFLAAISVVFCVGVAVYWVKKRPNNKLIQTALTLLFAGALGNAIDRVFRGYVVDFISTAFISFPVFNIADISIVTGAALLVIYLMLVDGKEEKNDENSTSDSK